MGPEHRNGLTGRLERLVVDPDHGPQPWRQGTRLQIDLPIHRGDRLPASRYCKMPARQEP
jgi:hypothetical protein